MTSPLDAHRGFITGCARRLGFDEIAATLGRLARPSLRLEQAEVSTAPGASRLGGDPDLPREARWPHAGDAGRPLTFVSQLALADLDASVWKGPHDGLLSFFGLQDPDTRLVVAGRVLHIPS